VQRLHHFGHTPFGMLEKPFSRTHLSYTICTAQLSVEVSRVCLM
jgi:hypothetical protein